LEPAIFMEVSWHSMAGVAGFFGSYDFVVARDASYRGGFHLFDQGDAVVAAP